MRAARAARTESLAEMAPRFAVKPSFTAWASVRTMGPSGILHAGTLPAKSPETWIELFMVLTPVPAPADCSAATAPGWVRPEAGREAARLEPEAPGLMVCGRAGSAAAKQTRMRRARVIYRFSNASMNYIHTCTILRICMYII